MCIDVVPMKVLFALNALVVAQCRYFERLLTAEKEISEWQRSSEEGGGGGDGSGGGEGWGRGGGGEGEATKYSEAE